MHRCGEGQLCHNLPGSYRCDCKPGFQRDAFGRTCIGKGCWGACLLCPFSFLAWTFWISASWLRFHTLNPLVLLASHPLPWVPLFLDHFPSGCPLCLLLLVSPADVNECWLSPGRLCQHTCENTPGSYRCSCAAGFVLAADGKHCEGTAHPDFCPLTSDRRHLDPTWTDRLCPYCDHREFAARMPQGNHESSGSVMEQWFPCHQFIRSRRV